MGDAEDMPIDDQSVDWVISNCVINLAPDKHRVFAEVCRVLKPGGRVAISDIVLGDELPDEVVASVDALVGCLAGAIRESEYLEAMRAAGMRRIYSNAAKTASSTRCGARDWRPASCCDVAAPRGCVGMEVSGTLRLLRSPVVVPAYLAGQGFDRAGQTSRFAASLCGDDDALSRYAATPTHPVKACA